VETLDLAGVFVTFFALLGPQKVLLPFGHVAHDLGPALSRKVAVLAGIAAALIGVVFAEIAPWLTGFFHVDSNSMELEGGIIFFLYAVALVFGVHLGADSEPDEEEVSDPSHPLINGFRSLLLPFVVSPLGITAVLVQALNSGSWGWRGTVAGAYAAVAIVNMLCMLLLAQVMRHVHTFPLEILSRLLGLLLAAVGVELFLQGLAGLGVHMHTGH
jgi:multiple antibiotic resistance protein